MNNSGDTNPQDEVFIVHFNDAPHLDKRFTSDIKALREGLVRTDFSGRAMRDAIEMSINYLRGNATKERKALVVVTGGDDNRSIISPENLLRDSRDSGVPVFTVGLLSQGKSIEAKRCRRELEALADATGGESFFPDEMTGVDRVAHQVSHDFRSQYTIAYTPSNLALDGTFRRVKVIAKGPNGPSVRTGSGYNALVNAGMPGGVIRATTAIEQSESLPDSSGDSRKPASLDDHSTLTDADVIKMVQTGLTQDVIIKVIADSPTDFKFLPSDLTALGQAKVPEAVFKAMTTKQAGPPVPAPVVEPGGTMASFRGSSVEPKSASNVMSQDSTVAKPSSTKTAAEQTRAIKDGQPVPVQSVQANGKIPVFVKSTGSVGGFTDPSQERQDSRKDLLKKLKHSKSLVVVDSENEALAVLEVLDRSTSREVNAMVLIGGHAQNRSTLVVRLTAGEYSVEFTGKSGSTGVMTGYGQAASHAVEQLESWVQANRDRLLALRK